jgi:hypothetical protein
MLALLKSVLPAGWVAGVGDSCAHTAPTAMENKAIAIIRDTILFTRFIRKTPLASTTDDGHTTAGNLHTTAGYRL